MIKKENILQETQQISQAVAAISKQNVYAVPAGYFDVLADNVLAGVQMANRPLLSPPFAVPDGYFDGLAALVMKKVLAQEGGIAEFGVKEELEQLCPLLNNASNKSPYKVPEGYFEALPDRVMLQIRQAGPSIIPYHIFGGQWAAGHLLNAINKNGPYTIPDGYFNGLAESVLGHINKQVAGDIQTEVFEELEQIAPLLNTISKKSPYGVPQGYFESLAGDVANGRDAYKQLWEHNEVHEELNEMAPLLNSASKKGPYSIPEGYFEQFAVNINEQAQGAKVVHMRRPNRTRWVAWLAAACITAIVATGGVLLLQNKPESVAAISSVVPDTSLSAISDEEINNYLNNMPAPGIETIPTSVLEDKMPDIGPALQNMSTEEIKDYLDKNSDPDDQKQKDI